MLQWAALNTELRTRRSLSIRSQVVGRAVTHRSRRYPSWPRNSSPQDPAEGSAGVSAGEEMTRARESSSPSRAPPTALPPPRGPSPPAACPSDPQLHTGLDDSASSEVRCVARVLRKGQEHISATRTPSAFRQTWEHLAMQGLLGRWIDGGSALL